MNQLGRFELIRRVLNHGALVKLNLNDPLFFGDIDSRTDLWFSALERYAARVRDSAESIDLASPGYPPAVRPVVDLANGMITHVTCTGNSRVVVRPAADLVIYRTWEATPRDRVLQAILAGTDVTTIPGLPVWLSPDDLAALGFPDYGVHVASSHGAWVLYCAEGVDTVLSADGSLYQDYEYDLGTPQWMAKAPAPLKDEIRRYLPFVEGPPATESHNVTIVTVDSAGRPVADSPSASRPAVPLTDEPELSR